MRLRNVNFYDNINVNKYENYDIPIHCEYSQKQFEKTTIYFLFQ